MASMTSCLGQEGTVPKGKKIVDLAIWEVIGKPINLYKPPFPSCNCKFLKVNNVSVRFVVNEKGYVESAEAVSGHPALKAVSVAAIRNSKFYESIASGVPVKAYGIINYEFKIKKKKATVSILNYDLKLQEDK